MKNNAVDLKKLCLVFPWTTDNMTKTMKAGDFTCKR